MTQLVIALSNLALQYLQWKTVIPDMVNSLGSNQETIPALLEFLKVLPEELATSRKLPITDEEYNVRTHELLVQNAERVLDLLLEFVNSAQFGALRSLVFQCFNSWLREIDAVKVVNSPLLDMIFQALNDAETFDPAIECLCSMIRETREFEEYMPVIKALYPRVISLRPKITECKNDPDAYSGYTRLFAEAGESWHMLIARAPKEFRGLVEAIAECTAFDEDLDVVKYTFYFWYILKQMIVTDKYNEARNELGDIYVTLVHIIIGHLQYPTSQSDQDLFSGDKEEEEKFKDFRHEMGDVLKDCCAVIGASKALGLAFQKVVVQLEAQSSGQTVTWQSIEAPLFSMRAMAREVDTSEDEILPQFMKILNNLPEHEKIRYAVTLVLGRYTEWTAKHPDYLELQLNYITSGFSYPSESVIKAAALALKHFCQDCSHYLTKFVDQLYPFYEKVRDSLDLNSYYEVTNGIAYVVASQPIDSMLQALQYFGKPICARLLEKAQLPDSEQTSREIADEIELLNIFVEVVNVRPKGIKSPTSQFVVEVLPVITEVLRKHGYSSFIAERSSKFAKCSLYSCGHDLLDILPTIAELLVSEFQKTHFGCYLWVTGTVLREFSDDTVSDEIKSSVWAFGQEQMKNFFQYLSTIVPANVPDLIDDFFRLMGDAIMYFPFHLISSELFVPSFEASLVALELNEYDPIDSSLQYLRDVFAYGSRFPRSSIHKIIPDEIRSLVVQLANAKGQQLCYRLISGLIYNFPKDVSGDATGLMLELFQLVEPVEALSWLATTLDALPKGTVSDIEKQKLLGRVGTALNSGDFKRIKMIISDFTVWYARRNLSRRE